MINRITELLDTWAKYFCLTIYKHIRIRNHVIKTIKYGVGTKYILVTYCPIICRERAYPTDYIPKFSAGLRLIWDMYSKQLCKYFICYPLEYPLCGVEKIIKYPNYIFVNEEYMIYSYIDKRMRYCRGSKNVIQEWQSHTWHHTKICAFKDLSNFTSKWKLL